MGWGKHATRKREKPVQQHFPGIGQKGKRRIEKFQKMRGNGITGV